MQVPGPHTHSYVDVDVDPCSFLAFEAIGEDSAVATRGNGEANCLSKGSSVLQWIREGGRIGDGLVKVLVMVNPWVLVDAFTIDSYAVPTAQHSICQPTAMFW